MSDSDVRHQAAPEGSEASVNIAGKGKKSFDPNRIPDLVLIPLVFVVTVAIWEFGVRLLNVPPFVLPPPSLVFESLVEQLQSPLLWRNFYVTAVEMFAGYALGVGLAFVLGVAISQIRLVEKVIFPYVVALQTVPKTALAPLFLIWFGFGITSKVITAALVAFFPMLVNVIEGLKSADEEKVEMLRSLGASRLQIFRMVQFPNALPFIFAGLDIGIIFALIGAVVGEFVGARAGLGYQLLQFNYNFNIAGMFAVLVVLSVMGIVPHYIIRLLQRRFAFWSGSGRVVGA